MFPSGNPKSKGSSAILKLLPTRHSKDKWVSSPGPPPREEPDWVVQKVDNAIHRINHYPADSVVCFVNTYSLDSDLSGG